MLSVSKLCSVLGLVAISTHAVSGFTMTDDQLVLFNEWKQSEYYKEACAKNFLPPTSASSASGSGTDATIVVPSSSSSSSDSYSTSTDGGEFSAGTVDVVDGSAGISLSASTSASGSAAASTTGSSASNENIEEQERFVNSLNIIAELQELHPYATFSINTPFALLTQDEFLAYVNRYAVDVSVFASTTTTYNSTSVSTSTTSKSGDGGPLTTDTQGSTSTGSSDGGIKTGSAAAGETVDWQSAGCVTDVKDQSECGACWAFSATAAMESGFCVETGSLPVLADQELISCDNAGQSQGCGGGYASYTMEWIAEQRGGKMCTLESYPFTSSDGTVAACAMDSCTEVDIGVTGYNSVREDPGSLEDIVKERPVSAFLYSGSSAFQFYTSGILTGDNCDKTGSHSALIVGYGTSDDGVLYWRLKNQWGTNWGESGYVRIQRRYSGDSEGACGVELYSSWPTFESGLTATPSTTTETPATTTATPTTEAPVATTATPTTEAPAATTATPTTEAPASTTAAPVSTTAAPAATTEAPVATTDAPAATTDTPTINQSTPTVTTASDGSEAPAATPAATYMSRSDCPM